MTTRFLLTLVGVAMLTLGTLGCDAQTRPVHNACDWPNACDSEVQDMILEIVKWAKADMLKDRTKTDVFQRLVRGRDRAKDPELTNREFKHVCLLENPAPCDEIRAIHAAAKTAKAATSKADAKVKWQACATMMDRFPSGTVGSP